MEEKFSLEEKLTEIRALVEKMQKGVADFDQQVELFKKGIDLIKECRHFLDDSEMQIQQLIEGEAKDVSSP